MFQHTQPAALDGDGGTDEWADFRVDHPRERSELLKKLRDGSVPVHLSAPDGTTLTTTLWAIDVARIAFSADGALPQLPVLVEANEAVAVAYLDNVKLQFDLSDLVLVRGGAVSTLQAAVPQDMYRFQRRGAFRVRPLPRSAPVVRLRHPAVPERALLFRVLDVSIGGCALWMPDDLPGLQAGTRIDNVQVELDEGTRFAATLTLRHVSSIGGSAAKPGGGRRLGCEWQLRGDAERSLQRWIDQAQKSRRMLASL